MAGFGVLVLLIAVFYQPILFAVIKIAARRFGASQHLRIDFDIGGSIFGGLHVDHLHVTPTAPGPIEKAVVGHLELHYSLPTLIRSGFNLNAPFLESVTLHDADVIYDPSKAPPPKPKKKEPFSLPPLPFPGQLSLRNVNFLLRAASKETANAAGQAAAASPLVPVPASPVVAATTSAAVGQGLLIQNLNLELDPTQNGELRVAELRIPGGPDLKDVSAKTSYRNRDLQLTDLVLAPDIRFRLLGIDASKLEQQLLGVTVAADLFKGHLDAGVRIHGISKPPTAQVRIDLKSLSLGSVHDFLALSLPLDGTVDTFSVRFDGQTDQPRSWDAQVDSRISGVAVAGATLDASNLRISLRDGVVAVEQADAVAGVNTVNTTARIVLANNMADLPKSDGRGTVAISAPDFSRLPVKLPVEMAGSLKAGGDFTLHGGKFSETLKGHVQDFAIPAQRVAVGTVDFALDSGKILPAGATAPPAAPGAPPPPHEQFWENLQSRLSVVADGITYTDYQIDGVRVTLSTDGPRVKLDEVAITRGTDRVDADGTYLLPEDFANLKTQPVDAHLSVAIPDLTQFAADPQNLPFPLQGSLNAKGNVQLRQGNYGGGFDLQARDLKARGATVQTADVTVGIENNVATVTAGRIVFDDRNTVDLTGHGTLQPPYPFQGGLAVDLTDLSRFGPALAANGVSDPVGGSLKIAGNVGGHLATSPDARDQQLDGDLTVTGRAIEAKGVKLQSVDTHIDVAGNTATIRTGSIKVDDRNGITFGGSAGVDGNHPFEGFLDVNLPDLGSLAGLLAARDAAGATANTVAGKAEAAKADTAKIASDSVRSAATARSTQDSARAAAHAKAAAATKKSDITAQTDPGLKVGGSFRLQASAKGHLASSPEANDPSLEGTVDVSGENIQAKGARIETIEGHIVADNEKALIKTFQVRIDGKNTIDINGQAATKAPFDYQASLNVNLADLGVFLPLINTSDKAKQITKAEIEAASKGKTPAPEPINGPATGGVRKTSVPSTTTATSAGQVKVAVKGTAGTPAMRAEIAQPLPTKLGGAFVVQWQAQGNFDKGPAGPKFSGGGKIVAHQVEYNTVGPLEADIEGQYSQTVVNFPKMYVGSNGYEYNSTLALKDALARLDNLHLKQGTLELISGYAQIPLDLTKLSAPGGPVPDVDKIDVNIASKALSLSALYQGTDKDKKSPVVGTVQLGVDAHGSLSKIVAEVKFQARGVRPLEATPVKPFDADLGLTLHDNRLDLLTVVRQPQIQPLTIKGNLPVDLKQIAEKKSLDPNSPVVLTVQLPRSSLGFLAGISKAVRFIQGEMSADVRVGGTVGKPQLSGSAQLDIDAARAENITVPAIRDFHARLAFTQKQLVFERFGGEIGGGKINLDGRVDLPTLTTPTLTLHATANNVLAVRDDNITARVNADVRVTGPLAGASVDGTVGLTKSRYLKDIDIVPINLPGKPAPAPPATAPAGDQGPASIGINAAPIKDWKLNLNIRTDDPFFVRGNLATGQATVDLHVRGTGAQPLLDGNVTVTNLTATLPFSRLEISNGNIHFTPDQPLNPVLDLTGTSQLHTYLVSVFVTGRVHDPKVTFSSDPPLGEQDIVSLLATGATTAELAGSGEALAGKATLLVAQDLYRRAFPKKASAREEPKSTLADRVNLDVGATDPSTGKQQVAASFKLTDTVSFVADLGVEGDLTGRVKYLVRFR